MFSWVFFFQVQVKLSCPRVKKNYATGKTHIFYIYESLVKRVCSGDERFNNMTDNIEGHLY